jgi:hypothetical protein
LINFNLNISLKAISVLLFFILSYFNSNAQSNNSINVCGKKESTENVTTLTLNELINCLELRANNVHLTVVSFLLIIKIDKETKIFKVNGNKLTERMVISQNQFRYSKLHIEKIKLSSKKGTIQPGENHTIILK